MGMVQSPWANDVSVCSFQSPNKRLMLYEAQKLSTHAPCVPVLLYVCNEQAALTAFLAINACASVSAQSPVCGYTD